MSCVQWNACHLKYLFIYLQKHLAELNVKFGKFQRPADFEPKQSHVKRELDNIQERIYLLEIRSDDLETLQQKHETCMVCFIYLFSKHLA